MKVDVISEWTSSKYFVELPGSESVEKEAISVNIRKFSVLSSGKQLKSVSAVQKYKAGSKFYVRKFMSNKQQRVPNTL